MAIYAIFLTIYHNFLKLDIIILNFNYINSFYTINMILKTIYILYFDIILIIDGILLTKHL